MPLENNDLLNQNDMDISFEKGKKPGAVTKTIEQTSALVSKVFKDLFGIVNPHHYLFLALLGTITAAIAFLTDLVSVYLIRCNISARVINCI